MFDVFGQLVAQYNSTLPTFSSGDFAVLSVDENGRALVANSGTFPVQVDGAALTALQLIDDIVLVEDAAHASGDKGVMPLAVRSDTLAAKAGTDGDYAPLQVDADGALYCKVSGNVAVTGTFWQATQPISAVSLPLPTGAATEATLSALSGKFGSLGQKNMAGSAPVVIASDQSAIPVSGSLTVSATALDIRPLTSGTDSVALGGAALTSLQLIDDVVVVEDTAHVSGDKGIMPLAVRKDAAGTLVGTDGDYAPLQVDANGNLRVVVQGTIQADSDAVFESGTAADKSSDDAGDGIIDITGSMTDLVSIAVGAGASLFITGMDVACDKAATYELVIVDNGTATKWLRVGVLAAGQPESHKIFERALEIAGQANRTVRIRARVNQGSAGKASGAINGYTR